MTETEITYSTDGQLIDHNPIFDTSILPDCPPKRIHVNDFEFTIGKTQDEIAKLDIHKRYASELIGIQNNESLPLELLMKQVSDFTAEEREEFGQFIEKSSKLLSADDQCDKIGIVFLANFFKAYLDSSLGNVPQLSKLVNDYAERLITYSKKAIVQYAKQLNKLE